MQNLKSGTLAVVVFLLTNHVLAAGLSFKDWKARRVSEKTSIIKQIQNNKTLSSEEKTSRIRAAQINLQTEKDLTPNDYFHLYIAEHFKNQPERARETVQRLSQKELADIVMGYLSLSNQIRENETTPGKLAQTEASF